MSFGVESHGTHRHEPMKCPACGYADLTASTRIGGEPGAPAAGDYTLCAECGEWLQYLIVEPPTVSASILTLARATIPDDMEPAQREKVEKAQAFLRARRRSFQ